MDTKMDDTVTIDVVKIVSFISDIVSNKNSTTQNLQFFKLILF